MELSNFAPKFSFSFSPSTHPLTDTTRRAYSLCYQINAKKTYERLLIAVKEKIPNSRPTRILVVFEKAVMNAFQKIFTDATLSGCSFHLCQSFVRKINEVGLKSVYEQNPGLALSLRMIPDLAFLPLEEVEPTFDLVVEELLSFEEDVLEKIDLLASYFQKTFLGHNIGSTNRPPVFQPVIWNQSVSAIDGLARTNNATEGWHFGLQTLFQGSHPNISIFLRQLKKDSLVHKSLICSEERLYEKNQNVFVCNLIFEF